MSRSDYVRAPIGLGLGGVQLHEKRNRSAVPGPFNLNMWTVSNAFTGDRIDLDLINVPHAEGAPVLDVERSINGGAWTSVGATSGVVPITGLTDGVEVVVQVRAVGAGGAGVPSNGKAVTPTWSAPVVAGTLTALDLPIGLPMNPIDLSAGFAVPGDPTLLSTTLSDRDAMLPDGLSVDPNSGLLSGTPGLASDATIVVRAINSGGFADSLFQLVVYGAPSIAGTLPDVLVDADVAMPTIEPRLAISVENDTDLSTVSWSLDPTSDALPSGVSIDTDTGAIQGIPTASGNHTIVVRASNAAGHATVSFMLSITAEDLALFDDPALTLIPTTEDPRNLLTWPASGTPVLTAQGGSLEGNVPVHLATSEVFARPEMSNISVNAGDELRASIVFEEPSADSVDLLRSTFKGGQEDYVDFVPSTGTLTHKSPGLIAAPSNLKVLPLSINRTRLEFDFVCNDASANFRFGVNGNSTDATKGMIYHSVAVARIKSGAGGGPGTGGGIDGGTGGKVATRFIYVAKPGTPGAGTPNNANTTLRTSFAAAKSAPMATIQAAINRAGTSNGVAVVVGPGQYFESVLITSGDSGTSTSPNFLVSETDRGAEIIGDASGSDAAPIICRSRNWQVHNFLLTGRTSANKQVAGVMVEYPDPPQGGDLPDSNIRIAGNHIRGDGIQRHKITKGRKVELLGNFMETRAGDTNTGVAVDWVTAIDCVAKWNTLFNVTCDAGFYIKGWSYGLDVDSNDVKVIRAGGTECVALKIGDLGFSRANREYPFAGSLVEGFAECHRSSFTNNRLETNYDNATHCRGSDLISYSGNWHKCSSSSTYLRTLNGIGARWKNQSKSIPSAFSQYVSYDNSTDRFTIESRRLTIGSGWVAAGTGTGVAQHANAGTSALEAPTVATNSSSVLTGTVGQDGWDRNRVLLELGLA